MWGVNDMKKVLSLLLVTGVLFCAVFCSGCSEIVSELNDAMDDIQGTASEVSDTADDSFDDDLSSLEQSSIEDISHDDERQSSAEDNSENANTYTMADVYALNNTEIFSSGALEHIFDGTINKKGKATGYHYTMISGSKGEVIEGTRSDADENGVFTGKVKVNGIKKNGFSSFYPESWTPQQVVDAINTAYNDALNDKDNPRGSLWIGHSGSLEIDMYFDGNKKITTAYPIYKGE